MKTGTKIIGLVLSAMLLVGATVLGTMAYLTSEDKVENTFTVGKVEITLDETDTDEYGVAIETAEGRVKENAYVLIPGKTYIKDPVVHVKGGSEKAWLFVKLENGLEGLEADDIEEAPYTRIASQITDKYEWELVEGTTNVYSKLADKATTDADYPVFDNFNISARAVAGITTEESDPNELFLGDYDNAEIIVTAYAVQAEGFDTAAQAWAATFGAGSGAGELPENELPIG